MITTSSAKRRMDGAAMSAALAAGASHVRSHAPGQWVVSLRPGEPGLRVKREEDWLIFQWCPKRKGLPPADKLESLVYDHWPMAKPALSRERLVLIADIPAENAGADSIAFLVRSLDVGSRHWQLVCNDGRIGDTAAADTAGNDDLEQARETVAAWLEDEHPGVRCVGPARWLIGVPEMAAEEQVEAAIGSGGFVKMSARLGGWGSDIAAVCRQALVLWMLRVNACLRLAKVSLDQEHALEVSASWPCAMLSGAMCRHLLTAVASGVICFGAEAAALADESIARTYLAITTRTSAENGAEPSSRKEV